MRFQPQLPPLQGNSHGYLGNPLQVGEHINLHPTGDKSQGILEVTGEAVRFVDVNSPQPPFHIPRLRAHPPSEASALELKPIAANPFLQVAVLSPGDHRAAVKKSGSITPSPSRTIRGMRKMVISVCFFWVSFHSNSFPRMGSSARNGMRFRASVSSSWSRPPKTKG